MSEHTTWILARRMEDGKWHRMETARGPGEYVRLLRRASQEYNYVAMVFSAKDWATIADKAED